jgi:hypothetical protein
MKLSEILTESSIITERPMGIMKRAGLGLASKFSSKAAGELASGKEANELKKDYDFWLGSSGKTSTASSFTEFLKQSGNFNQDAQKKLASIPGVNQNPDAVIPKNVVDNILTSIAQQAVTTGKVTPQSSTSSGGSNNKQSFLDKLAGTKSSASIDSVKSQVNKLSYTDRQKIIDYLKSTETSAERYKWPR